MRAHPPSIYFTDLGGRDADATDSMEPGTLEKHHGSTEKKR